MEPYYKKEITMDGIVDILKDCPDLKYPIQYNNGMYEISKGMYTGEKGYYLFMDALDKEMRKSIGR